MSEIFNRFLKKEVVCIHQDGDHIFTTRGILIKIQDGFLLIKTERGMDTLISVDQIKKLREKEGRA